MIDIIKEMFGVGDSITLHTNKISHAGRIKSYSDNVIIIANEAGKIIGVKGDSIESFEALEVRGETSSPYAEDTSGLVEEKMAESDVQAPNNQEPIPEPITPLPTPKYKVGDVIPPDVLEKRTEKKPKFAKIKGRGVTLDSLEGLQQLILPEIEAENKLVVSANGTITKYFGEREFGFIRDKYGDDIWFGFKNIVEDSLLKSLNGSMTNANIPVLFTMSKNPRGSSATCIQKPKTVGQVAELAKKFFDINMPDIALGMVKQILYSYPESRTAITLRQEIDRKQHTPQYNGKPTYRSLDFNYQKAKALHIHSGDKNYDEALKYYLLALRNNEKRESCIKDIAMLYVSMGRQEEALQFIKKHEAELPKNITTYNYLENLYSSLKDYQKGLENIERLLGQDSVLNDLRKHSLFLSKKGFALMKLGKLEKAKQVLEQALRTNPENRSAHQLLLALNEPNNEESSRIIADPEFDSYGGGLSRFITDTLDSYQEYSGLSAKVKESGNFSIDDLSTIRKREKTEGKARPRDRANLLLTEAKLLVVLEPEGDDSLRSVLARHCNAMALSLIYNKLSRDVIRNYYLEAFNLEENWDSVKRQVELYLLTYKYSHEELMDVSRKPEPNINDTLKIVLGGDMNEYYWEGVLSMFLWNGNISAQLIPLLFEDNQLKGNSLVFLNAIGIPTTQTPGVEDYKKLWARARERRQMDYSRWLATIKAISGIETIETFANQLADSLNEAKKDWLTQSDALRLKRISTDIHAELATYLRQSGYRDRERSFNSGKAQINQLISEIKEKPTKFSYEGFIPLLEKMDLLLGRSFDVFEQQSDPKVDISMLGEANFVGEDKVVSFQLKIENAQASSPIRNISIRVKNDDNVVFIEKNNEYADSVHGGENHIFKLAVKVSEKVIKEKAASIHVSCSYIKRNQDEPHPIEQQLSLRLYSEEEFEPIDNHYGRVAESGPVRNENMFYGRGEFINQITDAIISTEYKQVVIYGQKRSGKSSVLYHLQKKLEKEHGHRTFCVSFSIGEIIGEKENGDIYNLSSATFFHKILSVIEEKLEDLMDRGLVVPDFKCPSLKELKDSANPADVFRKHIRNFKRAWSAHETWKDKRLVVMIDEFTYLYSAIKKTGLIQDTFMKQWKAITQNEGACLSSVLVGQDVFPHFKSEFANEFGTIQDERLTYLKREDAVELIQRPIWNKKSDKSRFLEDAVARIIDYTSCNPYYIQMFCARLVNEMNSKKIIEVTRSDIKSVADTFVSGGQALKREKFDNLLNAGEEHDVQRIPQKDSEAVLKEIATNTRHVPYCSREQIKILDEKYMDKILDGLTSREYTDMILHDLTSREVIEREAGNYRIQVKLFQEWLLKN